jgi:phage shock protein C
MDMDVSLVRLLFVAVCIISAIIPMLLFYIIAWIVIPVGIKVTEKEDVDVKTGQAGKEPKD